MNVKMSSNTKVNCVNCDYENIAEFDTLKNLRFIECKKCGTSFNLFWVYQSLYKTIPLCEKMINVTVDHTYAIHKIDAAQPQEQENIEQTLEENRFQELLTEILHDMVLYGNSFIQIIPEDPTLKLQRLEPRELKFRIDWVQEPPRRSYQQKIVEIKRYDSPSIEYEVANCLHFKEGLSLSEPIGHSVCGFWFTTWYLLRDICKKFPLLDMQGEKYSNLKGFRDFEESGVLAAAGIPHKLIFPWMRIKPNIMRMEQERFQHDIERRRKKISRLIERQLFPRILGRNYEYKNFPRLVFHD